MKLYSIIALLLLLLLFACSPCDIDQPDTAANRKGFEANLGFRPTKEITDVYFYADEWGGDAKIPAGIQSSSKCGGCHRETAGVVAGKQSGL